MTHFVTMKLHQWHAESQRADPELAARILFMETSTLPDNPELAKTVCLR